MLLGIVAKALPSQILGESRWSRSSVVRSVGNKAWAAAGVFLENCRGLLLTLCFLLLDSQYITQRNALKADMEFVKNITQPDFQAKDFTPQKRVNCDIFLANQQRKCIKY